MKQDEARELARNFLSERIVLEPQVFEDWPNYHVQQDEPVNYHIFSYCLEDKNRIGLSRYIAIPIDKNAEPQLFEAEE